MSRLCGVALSFAAEESPFPELAAELRMEPAEQTLDDDLLPEPGQPPEEGAYSETENEMHDLESEEDYGALLSETNALGLNNGADTEEPLTLPEDSDIPDTTGPCETESGELVENERRSPDSIGGRTARAAPMRERLRRETTAQAQRDNRILTIDAHDDILTEAERQEIVWHEIRNSHISQQILTGSLDSMERTPSGIVVAVATYKGFRIVIPLKEMLVLPSRWPTREARAEAMAQLPRLVNMRMGCEIDFIVRGIDSKKRSIVASRRAAMLRKRQTFYMERGDAGEPMIYPGRIVQARVVAVADIISVLMILGVGVIAVWDGLRNGFTFRQFFLRFVLILTIYKICDMTLIDNFLLMKFHFFQHYYPETEQAMEGRKYDFNLKSQLMKLFVIFPAVSALAAWICTLF